MNATRNTLSASTRKKAVTLLNNTVADLFDLYARTKQRNQ
jgi:DNA-binding ferritin-like protein